MNYRLPSSCLLIAIVGVLVSGCEPDDPAVRKELVEMRTELANIRQELDETKAALVVARAKAERVNFLEAESLADSLRSRESDLRGAIVQALPDFNLIAVSISRVDTPMTSATPYGATIHFKVQPAGTGRTLGPFSLRLLGDRNGEWRLPTPAEISSTVGAMARVPAAAPDGRVASPANAPGPAAEGARQIQWGDQEAAAAPAASERPAPARENAPDPMPGAGETREVSW